ncbi:SAM-dependent methyltransferase [Burkholderia ubonensis]|uniref:SAM-dependent methyltransferase n=1 Tax=Burkholderia ubonensis TaxID=101571 RepID=UPI000A673E56|nr:SAM-dependent methyltransferase [Burkholderia ubonensis]
MSMPLTDFLVTLADPGNYEAYINDPDGFMKRAGLNEKQRIAVKSGSRSAIRLLASEEMNEISFHAKLATEIYAENNKTAANISHQESIDDIDAIDMDYDDDTDNDNNNDDYGNSDLDVEEDVSEGAQKYTFGPHYDHLFEKNWQATRAGELVFVGSGIKGTHHITPETSLHIRTAGKVLYCVADVVVERKIRLLNNNCEDLYELYADDKPRRKTYEEMVEHSLEALNHYEKVCVVFYGHPGIFVWSSFTAIQKARRDGIKAYMLPAVSSLDCMFADIGFDPSRRGCQIFEATDFLTRTRTPDTAAAVIILQLGAVGDMGFRFRGYDRRNMPVFVEYLQSFYGADHEVILYQAAQYPVCEPVIQKVAIRDIVAAKPTGITTLYIPPKTLPATNSEMVSRLGLGKLAHQSE